MRSLPINLRYLSTSLLWWQAVVGMIGANRATRCACMRRTRGDAARAGQTSTMPPSAACSARCASAGASPQRSTAAPEAWYQSGASRALRDNTVARPGGATTPSPPHATGCTAHPPRLFWPPGHGHAPTRYASEPIAIPADERHRARGRPSGYCRGAGCLAPSIGSGSKET